MKKRIISAILSMATAVSSVTAITSNAVDERGKLSESMIEYYREKEYQQLEVETFNCVNFVDSEYLFMKECGSFDGRIDVDQYENAGDLLEIEFDSDVDDNDVNEIIEQIKFLDKELDILGSSYMRITKENISPDVVKKIRELVGDKAVLFRFRSDMHYGMRLTFDYITGYDVRSYINVVEREEEGKIYKEYDTVNNRNVLEKYAENHSDEVEFKAYGGSGKDFRGFELWRNVYYLIPKKELSTMEHIELAEDIYEETGLRPFGYELESAGSPGGYTGANLDLTDYLNGDANRDKITTIADAAAIMQAIANPDKYALSDLGEFNADFACDGLTVDDAVAIQKKLAGIAE